MASSARDRLSVDLHGLKAALLDQARGRGMSPSTLVRLTLAGALDRPVGDSLGGERLRRRPCSGDRVRVCLRMSSIDARATAEAARHAGLSLGDYVGGLVAGVPVLVTGARRGEHIAALAASCAELSTLSRNIHRLTALLRQADVAPARPYRDMLDRVDSDVRQHLEIASKLLAELQPSARNAGAASRRTR